MIFAMLRRQLSSRREVELGGCELSRFSIFCFFRTPVKAQIGGSSGFQRGDVGLGIAGRELRCVASACCLLLQFLIANEFQA